MSCRSPRDATSACRRTPWYKRTVKHGFVKSGHLLTFHHRRSRLTNRTYTHKHSQSPARNDLPYWRGNVVGPHRRTPRVGFNLKTPRRWQNTRSAWVESSAWSTNTPSPFKKIYRATQVLFLVSFVRHCCAIPHDASWTQCGPSLRSGGARCCI